LTGAVEQRLSVAFGKALKKRLIEREEGHEEAVPGMTDDRKPFVEPLCVVSDVCDLGGVDLALVG